MFRDINYMLCEFLTCGDCGKDHFVGPPQPPLGLNECVENDKFLYCEIKMGFKSIAHAAVRKHLDAFERYLDWQVHRPRLYSNRGYSMLAVVYKKEQGRLDCPISWLPKEILLMILSMYRSPRMLGHVRLHKEEFKQFISLPYRKDLYERYQALKRKKNADREDLRGRLWCELIEPAVDRYPGPSGLM